MHCIQTSQWLDCYVDTGGDHENLVIGWVVLLLLLLMTRTMMTYFITVQQYATCTVYYISVGSSACFGC